MEAEEGSGGAGEDGDFLKRLLSLNPRLLRSKKYGAHQCHVRVLDNKNSVEHDGVTDSSPGSSTPEPRKEWAGSVGRAGECSSQNGGHFREAVKTAVLVGVKLPLCTPCPPCKPPPFHYRLFCKQDLMGLLRLVECDSATVSEGWSSPTS